MRWQHCGWEVRNLGKEGAKEDNNVLYTENKISGPGAVVLRESLMSNTTLTELVLSGNDFYELDY